MPEPAQTQSDGYQVKGLLECPKCEHSNAIGTRYCDNCGASLANVKPAEKQMEASSEGRGFLGRLFGRK